MRRLIKRPFIVPAIGTSVLEVTENNSDKIDLANNVYTAVRKLLEKRAEDSWIKNLQQINREIAMRKFLSTWIWDKAERQSANNVASLSDWIMWAEASSNPYAMAWLVGKKLLPKYIFWLTKLSLFG